MKNDDLLQTILESYDDSNYPEAFVSEYDIMECLSDQNGICTFLVQKKDGENCIAKCYDKFTAITSDDIEYIDIDEELSREEIYDDE